MNNVNVQKMEQFVTTIQEDPAQAQKEKRVTGSWVFDQGKPQFVSTIEYAKGNVVLNAELPPFAGGWGTRHAFQKFLWFSSSTRIVSEQPIVFSGQQP